MPSTTSKGWPYVGPTDVVADYPTTSQALANKLEANIPTANALGFASVVISAVETNGTTTVTFPVGRFTGNPLVVLGAIADPANVYPVFFSSTPTTASMVLVARRKVGTTTVVIHYWAAQI